MPSESIYYSNQAKLTDYAPNGKAFPRSWGKPPEIQTKDYRPLPYGYGHGSSTLYHWIEQNKNE